MKTTSKFISIFLLIATCAFAFAAPARAFDEKSGATVVIEADEVIDDDLYVSANEFTLDGTVTGDLVVFGTYITINGTVEGDLIAAGQVIILNGTVMDDARMAGAVLQIGDEAKIGDDLVGAGASLETKDGSMVGGELVAGAGQMLLAGDIAGDVIAGTGALELRGEFGGNVQAEVGDPDPNSSEGPPMSSFLSMFIEKGRVDFPEVNSGLSISKDASIKGDFQYTQTRKIDVPAGVVGGKVTHTKPVIDPTTVEVKPTRPQLILTWTLNLLRTIISFILVGLLLGWLAPVFLKTLMDKAQTKPVASLGWGVVTYAAFFFAILVILVAMGIGAAVFGMLTLGKLSGYIIWIGLLSIFALAVAFALATAFVAKIVVAWLGGKLIVSRIKPEMTEHKWVPLALGVILLAVLMALPLVGWVFSLLATLLGLGALWMWGSELRQAKQSA